MVDTANQRPYSNQDLEDAINDVIMYGVPKKRAARERNIPISTLRSRLRRRSRTESLTPITTRNTHLHGPFHSLNIESERIPRSFTAQQLLTDDEEQSLILRILSLCDAGECPTKNGIEQMAEQILKIRYQELQKTGINIPVAIEDYTKIGKTWIYSFFKRHRNVRYQNGLTIQAYIRKHGVRRNIANSEQMFVHENPTPLSTIPQVPIQDPVPDSNGSNNINSIDYTNSDDVNSYDPPSTNPAGNREESLQDIRKRLKDLSDLRTRIDTEIERLTDLAFDKAAATVR